MTMPTDVGAIDLMIGFPKVDAAKTYDYLRQTHARARSAEHREFPAGYMFKDVPNQLDEGDDGVDGHASPRWTSGASRSAWSVSARDATDRALKEHPDRFIGSLEIDPNDITGAVRKIRAAEGRARHQGGDDVPRRLQPAGAR